MDIKGIAHLTLTVNDFEASLPFYKQLFQFLGMREMIVREGYYYCVGKRIGLGIQQGTATEARQFDQGRTGLHHFCLAMNAREDVDALAELVRQLGVNIVREPSVQDHWFPGMYSVLFEDPNGIRIEANHLPKPN